MKVYFEILENTETGKTIEVPLTGTYFIEEAIDLAILNTKIYGDKYYIKDIVRREV